MTERLCLAPGPARPRSARIAPRSLQRTLGVARFACRSAHPPVQPKRSAARICAGAYFGRAPSQLLSSPFQRPPRSRQLSIVSSCEIHRPATMATTAITPATKSAFFNLGFMDVALFRSANRRRRGSFRRPRPRTQPIGPIRHAGKVTRQLSICTPPTSVLIRLLVLSRLVGRISLDVLIEPLASVGHLACEFRRTLAAPCRLTVRLAMEELVGADDIGVSHVPKVPSEGLSDAERH
jgi:hypothetical protein